MNKPHVREYTVESGKREKRGRAESSREKSGFFCDAGNILVFFRPFIVTAVGGGETFRQNRPGPTASAMLTGTLTLFGRVSPRRLSDQARARKFVFKGPRGHIE